MSGFLSADEQRLLILLLGYARRDGIFTEAEADIVVHWAETTRMNAALLQDVLDGSMLVDVKDGNADEQRLLILLLGYARRDGIFTEAEADIVVHWAETTRMNAALLQDVLDGSMLVDVKDGNVAFAISPKGDAEVEVMLAKADK